MKAKIVKFLVEKDKLTQELKEWVKDKSISLDERWEVFIESDLGTHKCSYEDFAHFNSDMYCDDTRRGATIYLSDVEDTYFENNTLEEINEFKEDVLNSFIKSFEFDW